MSVADVRVSPDFEQKRCGVVADVSRSCAGRLRVGRELSGVGRVKVAESAES